MGSAAETRPPNAASAAAPPTNFNAVRRDVGMPFDSFVIGLLLLQR
jgi:hypothetical protein